MDVGNPKRGRGGPLTSLVFPTYNPGPLVEHTWHEVERFLRFGPGNWEVLFVCDGCTDGTPERLRELTAGSDASVRVLSYTPNRGKGHAVRTGLAEARGAWRIFADVDLAYGFDDIARVADILWQGAEVAIASRTHPDSHLILPTALQGYAYRRHLQSMIFAVVVRLLLPLTVGDTQAGLKGLSARAAHLVLPLLRCDGFGFDCELLTACVHHGLAITEVPVCVRYADRASTLVRRDAVRMVREIWSIRQAARAWQPARRLPEVPAASRQAA